MELVYEKKSVIEVTEIPEEAGKRFVVSKLSVPGAEAVN
jgi:hypothetical protein